MKDIVNQIYQLLHSPIVTPHNLLDNAKLANYDYVNYYKHENGLIAEMSCKVDNNNALFYYYFDEKDSLQKIYMSVDSQEKLVFDRNDELTKTITQYMNEKEPLKVAL